MNSYESGGDSHGEDVDTRQQLHDRHKRGLRVASLQLLAHRDSGSDRARLARSQEARGVSRPGVDFGFGSDRADGASSLVAHRPYPAHAYRRIRMELPYDR